MPSNCTSEDFKEPSITEISTNTVEKLEDDFEKCCEKEIILKEISNVGFDSIKKLDLSNKRLTDLPYELKGLSKLTDLNISNNEFVEIPLCLLNGMKSIEILDLSKNRIEHLKKQPACAAKLKILKLQSNNITELPDWLGSYSIKEIYLSENGLLFSNVISSQSVMNKTSTSSAKFKNYSWEFSPSLQRIYLGLNKNSDNSNTVRTFPFNNIINCSNLEHLNLENVQLSDIETCVSQFQNLVSVNFSNNFLTWLPDEFCYLKSLKECILSHNNIIFLPPDFGLLKNLQKLHLNSNNLESLPASIAFIDSLLELDIYNNNLSEFPDISNCIEAMDGARNVFEEPSNNVYAARKQKFREKYSLDRYDGSVEDKYAKQELESDESSNTEDYGSDVACDHNEVVYQEDENWDTDEYWEPSNNLTEIYLAPSNDVEIKMEEYSFATGQFDDD